MSNNPMWCFPLSPQSLFERRSKRCHCITSRDIALFSVISAAKVGVMYASFLRRCKKMQKNAKRKGVWIPHPLP